MSPLDVDDISRCPRAETCAGCGRSGSCLGVATALTSLGVLCVTLCRECAQRGNVPSRTAPETARAVIEHCEHLGCDLDEMAEALAGEDR